MVHPYAKHKEHHVAKRRANKLKHGSEYKRGGAAHGDEAADRKLVGTMIREHDAKVDGKKGAHRLDKFARGGKVKHKGDVNIAVVVPHRAPSSPMPAGPSAAGAPAPVATPPGLPPGGPPGMPPGLPPGMPMHARGGKVTDGRPTAKNLKAWAGYAKKASGGRVGHKFPHMTAGASSGVGRLEEVADAKKRRK